MRVKKKRGGWLHKATPVPAVSLLLDKREGERERERGERERERERERDSRGRERESRQARRALA